MFAAGLILAIMVVPIIASVCRDFPHRPARLRRGRSALGATRWEMVRGVVLPYRAARRAAVILGLGRALGEAIAVTQVIGAGPAIHVTCSRPATRSPAGSRPNSPARPRTSSSALFYLAVVLLAIGLVTNLPRSGSCIVSTAAGRASRTAPNDLAQGRPLLAPASCAAEIVLARNRARPLRAARRRRYW